ncbi:hypothetical protein ACFUIV_22325 [Streptomyces anulatus]|uniref:hypothetical protein n=1 Tax=Streptomyces anulatus TaxID=1892 RepID=UPI003645CBDE
MSIEMPPVGGDAGPGAELSGAVPAEVDEVLAGALAAQGDAGVRALGLLHDARRALTEAGFARPAEVAAACVRSAADALLGLPGAPQSVGLQAAAQDLVAALDTIGTPPAAGAGSPQKTAEGTAGQQAPAGGAVAAGDASGDRRGLPGGAGTRWERVTAAAEVLRGELERPGGYHRGRARGVIEQLTGVTLGAAQEQALDVWGVVYGLASGILHGRSAGPDDAVLLYTELLGAARELLVPLAERAARVLELTALKDPGAPEAAELARWADPRAEAYFFRSGPAPVWLGVLQEYAPHLLLPDRDAGGRWPAAPFLGHVAAADPDAARAWLTAPDDEDPAVSRAEKACAAGRPALDAVLGLALAHPDVVAADQVRAVLADTAAVRDGGGPAAGATLRLAGRWARTVPRAERTRDWIIAVEGLLAGAVEDEHSGHLSLHAVAERVAAAEEAAEDLAAAGDPAAAQAAMAAALAQEEKLRDQIAEEAAARLPGSEAAVLLRELAVTAYPDGPSAPAHRDVAMIRAVLAGLLTRDIALLPAASRPQVFRGDLALAHTGDSAPYGGPRLARTVLDLAGADADAGIALAVRTRALRRVAAVDAALHDRLMAAHLAARPPAPAPVGQIPAPAGVVNEWWERAVDLTERLVAVRPAPEPARLVDLVFSTCPPGRAGELETRVRTALGAPPPAAAVEEALPAGADGVDGLAEPLASWLRVWDWSPLLPARVLAGWEPVLERVRPLKPAGPADPRTAPAPVPVTATTALTAEDLAEPAEARGPLAAAAALAAAPDAGDDGYAMVLHHLIAAGPAAWTADPPAILGALQLPELGAFYLAAAAVHADRPGAFPGTTLTGAVTAALGLRRALDAPAPTAGQKTAADRGAGLDFADQALADLLTAVWRTDAVLDPGQGRDVLAHLHALAAELTDPTDAEEAGDGPVPAGAVGPAPGAPADRSSAAGNPAEPALLGSDPRVRALGCLLEYAVHQVRARGQMPAEVLQAVAGALPAAAAQDAVADAIGVRLPALHRYAPDFTAAHRTALYRIPSPGPSPAGSWLRWGPPSPPLLAALDRADLIGALRGADGLAPGAAGHTAAALLTDPALLGEPASWWMQLAAPDGDADADGDGDAAAAVSGLLEAIALCVPRTGAARPLPPAEQARTRAAVDLWRAALAAGLPTGALAGVGAFADAAVDEPVWLELTRSSAEHSPALSHADLVAERAAAHPGSQDALLLAELLVTHAPGTWTDTAVRGHARTLLDATAAMPAPERPPAWQGLRRALVNAGDVAAARQQ